MMIASIDPGMKGAVAIFDSDTLTVSVHDAPTAKAKRGNEYVVAAMAELLSNKTGNQITGFVERIIIEHQHAYPHDSKVGAFRNGYGYGLWIMAAAMLRVPLEVVRPQEWKRDVGIPAGSPKDYSRAIASRLYPGIASQFKRVKDDGRAEAVLIGHAWLLKNAMQ